MDNRNCGNCVHGYSVWIRYMTKLVTICVGCSEKMPDGSLRMIDKIVNWTDAPCENYKPWMPPDADDGDDTDE